MFGRARLPFLLLLPLLCSCPKLVDNVVSDVTSPANREKYAELLGDTEIQAAAHDLAASLTGGALDGLTDAERQAKLAEVTRRLVGGLADQLEADLDAKLGPVLRDQVAALLARSMEALLSDRTRKDAKKLADEVVTAAVDAFTRTATANLATGMKEELGPAIQVVIEANLAPALANALGAQKEPLADLVQTFTRSAADGLAESLATDGKLGKVLDEREARFRGEVDAAKQATIIVGAVALALLAALGGLAWFLRRVWREKEAIRQDREHGDLALLRLAQAVKAVEDTPAARYIAARMREENPTPYGQKFKRIIDANKDTLRVDPGPESPRERAAGLG